MGEGLTFTRATVFRARLRRLLEGGERLGPKPIEVGAERLDARGVELVSRRRLPAGRSTTRCACFSTRRCCEIAGRLMGKSPARSPTGAGSLEQALEDRAASGVAQRVHLAMLVSFH